MDSRDMFNLLIYAVIIVGMLFALRRLYQDFTRPLDDDYTDHDH